MKKNTVLGNNALKVIKDKTKMNEEEEILFQKKKGYQNTAIGGDSTENNKSGINNTAVGYRSLRNITTGNRNIGLGGFSGAKNKVGNNNIYLGFKADSLTTDSFNEIVIGSSSIGHGSNTIVLGNEESKKIEPSKDNNLDIGSDDYSFKDIYIKGNIKKNGINMNEPIDNKIQPNHEKKGIKPDYIGQIYVDTSLDNEKIWISYGLSIGQWKRVSN